MSRIIKSSSIIGTYLLQDKAIDHKKVAKKGKGGGVSRNSTQPEESGTNKQADALVDQARNEAEQIINQAEEKANDILEQAKQEAAERLDKYKEEGYQSGYEHGQQEGYQTGLSKTADALATLESIIIETKNKLENRVEQLSSDIIDLALKIADRIVNSHLQIEPALIADIVKEMVQDINNINKVDIYIHPDLLGYINEKDLKDSLTKQKVNIMGDPHLEIGDCIIETELGGRDGTLNNKLRLLERELLKGAGFNEGS